MYFFLSMILSNGGHLIQASLNKLVDKTSDNAHDSYHVPFRDSIKLIYKAVGRLNYGTAHKYA